MSGLPPACRLFDRRALTMLTAGFALLGLASVTPAFAQAVSCQEIAGTLQERQTLIQRLSALGAKGKKVDPKVACTSFSSLVTNGNKTLKWMETNKDWCQIPDALIANIKNDHVQAEKLRGQACKVAAQITEMEKKARSAQGGGGSGLLGGDGLTGSYKIPQGAM
jgi:hypothetical protein